MTSNNPQQQEEQNKRATSKKSHSDFITSPIDHDRRNALQDRELRPYLKYSENFNRLVKAGILLSDGRVVCSEEQWKQTREIIVNKIQTIIYGRSQSSSPDTKFRRSRASGKTGSSNSEPSPSPRPGGGTGRSSSHQFVENPYDTASQSSDELWGNMSNNGVPGPSKEGRSSRKGSAYSRDSISKRSSQSVHQAASGKSIAGKVQSTSAMKGERVPHLKKNLREQDAINKQRILDELRRDERKKTLHDNQQQIKEQMRAMDRASEEEKRRKRSTGQTDESMKQATTNKALRTDPTVLSTLEQSRDILKAMKDGVGEQALRAITQTSGSDSATEKADLDSLDALFLDLFNRQDRLFRALGERNVDEISSLLDLVPADLEIEHKPIFKQYGPHAQLQKIVDDLLRSTVTEENFFKEAAELVKLMHPSQIIEHIGMCIASKTGPRRILKVTSHSAAVDRFGLAWSLERPSRDKAMSVASRLVDDAIEQGRSVHTYLTEGSGVNLSLLAIGSPDPLVAAPRHVNVGDLTIEPYNDEHVSFSDRNVVRPRPLEDGVAVADLKPVLDRPPTPIPDAERVRRKSRERLEADSAHLEAKKKARELVQDIRQDSEKRLRRKMKHDGLKTDKKTIQVVKQTTPFAGYREQLKERVYTRLTDWKMMESERNRQLARVVESISDLVPHVVGAQRDRFVRSISRQVSSIVSTTLKQAQEIMLEAMNMSEDQATPEANVDEDSDDFESVSSAMLGETKPEDQLGEASERAADEGDEQFKPIFGDSDLRLNQNVISSGLAAISVKHGEDGHGHDGHSHAPPVSHMKQFFKNRASMPAISAVTGDRAADRKRHSMPAALPECMDPSKLHGRHSFLSVVRPDVKTLPEYRDKTQRQVETVLQDHSVFGRLQELSPTGSDDEDVLASEDLGQPDEEIVPKFRRQRLPLPAAEAPDDEEEDSVSELPLIDEDAHGEKSPRAVASTPVARRPPDPEDADERAPAPTAKTQSLTPSRMMLRCDSDPRLSLRTSTAEVHVDVHQHSQFCEHHKAHGEAVEELQLLESSAFGINAERTASASRLSGSESVMADVRRSGSADGGPLTHPDVDSDDETELRVRHPTDDDGADADRPSRYY